MVGSKALTVIFKPTSECNFRCKYCYHADTEFIPGIISDDNLEKLIKLAQVEYDRIEYIWHGGEPLMCGLGFFKKVISLQKKFCKSNQKILNSIQTNGSLLTDNFIKFFLYIT